MAAAERLTHSHGLAGAAVEMTRQLSVHLDMDLPDCFTVSLHESCRIDDKEPFCVGLLKRDGIRRSHHAGLVMHRSRTHSGKPWLHSVRSWRRPTRAVSWHCRNW